MYLSIYSHYFNSIQFFQVLVEKLSGCHLMTAWNWLQKCMFFLLTLNKHGILTTLVRSHKRLRFIEPIHCSPCSVHHASHVFHLHFDNRIFLFSNKPIMLIFHRSWCQFTRGNYSCLTISFPTDLNFTFF
jgi:hypothetical protein